MTTNQIRARFGRMYALALTLLTVMAVTCTVWAGNAPSNRMDVSAMMNSIDVGSLPVHNITDAF